METAQLLLEWQDVLQCDAPLDAEMNLAEIEEWDSLSQMSMAAFFDRKLRIQVSSETLAKCATIRDLLHLAGKE